MNAYFQNFDKDKDGLLNRDEFTGVCKALFQNDKGVQYIFDDIQINEIFEVFDSNRDNNIDKQEFEFCWKKWIKVINRPSCALIIVDVQNDFISGSLSISQFPAGHNGIEVIDSINRLLDNVQFDAVFYSLDWHPFNHVSFFEDLQEREFHSSSPISKEEAKMFDTVIFEGDRPMTQRLWPRHCVENTWGAELHPDLKIVDGAMKIYKGTSSYVDSYSAFWDNMRFTQTNLSDQLKQKQITDIFICGIAYDICVAATIADASSAGYRTILIDDCGRGVEPDDIEKTKSNIIKNHGVIITSEKVQAMVEGKDRRPELGYKLAMELKKEIICL